MHSALPARLLIDDSHAYILMDREGGNLVSVPGVAGNMSLGKIELTDSPNQLTAALTLKCPSSLVI